MPILYPRRARATIAGLVIDQRLRMAFKVERTVERTQPRGHASRAAAALLSPLRLRWYVDGSIIRINGARILQPDAPPIETSPETGMIDTLRMHDDDDGASVRMFLNPLAMPGGRLTVRSMSASGAFKIIAVKHVGDTWDGRFVTHCELENLA